MGNRDKKARKLIVIAGPTAVGKTHVAIAIARELGAEIISADSRQLFKEMEIGTAKPSQAELTEVPHHFINSHSIHDKYTAADFGHDATLLLNELFQRSEYAILCGGSGLYIKAVCEGFDDIPEIDPKIRDELNELYKLKGLASLQEKLKELDPEHYTTLDNQNPVRLIRALEVKLGTGESIRSFHNKNKRENDFLLIKIGLELEREKLYKRIDDRMDQMITSGLFDEAKLLMPFRHYNALQTVGYQEIFDYMEGNYDREEAIRLLKRNSRHYAKRQLTWFKRDPSMVWFNPGYLDDILMFIRETGNE